MLWPPAASTADSIAMQLLMASLWLVLLGCVLLLSFVCWLHYARFYIARQHAALPELLHRILRIPIRRGYARGFAAPSVFDTRVLSEAYNSMACIYSYEGRECFVKMTPPHSSVHELVSSIIRGMTGEQWAYQLLGGEGRARFTQTHSHGFHSAAPASASACSSSSPFLPAVYHCEFRRSVGWFIVVLESIRPCARYSLTDLSNSLSDTPIETQALRVMAVLARMHTTYLSTNRQQLEHTLRNKLGGRAVKTAGDFVGNRALSYIYALHHYKYGQQPISSIHAAQTKATQHTHAGSSWSTLARLPSRLAQSLAFYRELLWLSQLVFDRFLLPPPAPLSVSGIAPSTLDPECFSSLCTFIHGDAHCDNFLFGSVSGCDDLRLIDWTAARIEHPLFDVAYFMLTSLPADVRRARERECLRYYCERLGVCLVVPSQWAAVWRTYRALQARIVILHFLPFCYVEGQFSSYEHATLAYRTRLRITREVCMELVEDLASEDALRTSWDPEYSCLVRWVVHFGVIYSHKYLEHPLYRQLHAQFQQWQHNMNQQQQQKRSANGT
jgi:hypothetical protein